MSLCIWKQDRHKQQTLSCLSEGRARWINETDCSSLAGAFHLTHLWLESAHFVDKPAGQMFHHRPETVSWTQFWQPLETNRESWGITWFLGNEHSEEAAFWMRSRGQMAYSCNTKTSWGKVIGQAGWRVMKQGQPVTAEWSEMGSWLV